MLDCSSHSHGSVVIYGVSNVGKEYGFSTPYYVSYAQDLILIVVGKLNLLFL